MSQFVVLHNHRYGVSVHIVECASLPPEKQIVRCLGLNYEPSKEESLDIQLITSDQIVVLDYQDGDDEDFVEPGFEDDVQSEEQSCS